MALCFWVCFRRVRDNRQETQKTKLGQATRPALVSTSLSQEKLFGKDLFYIFILTGIRRAAPGIPGLVRLVTTCQAHGVSSGVFNQI